MPATFGAHGFFYEFLQLGFWGIFRGNSFAGIIIKNVYTLHMYIATCTSLDANSAVPKNDIYSASRNFAPPGRSSPKFSDSEIDARASWLSFISLAEFKILSYPLVRSDQRFGIIFVLIC